MVPYQLDKGVVHGLQRHFFITQQPPTAPQHHRSVLAIGLFDIDRHSGPRLPRSHDAHEIRVERGAPARNLLTVRPTVRVCIRR